jgi:hypothetical protein
VGGEETTPNNGSFCNVVFHDKAAPSMEYALDFRSGSIRRSRLKFESKGN